jgi:ATP-dependent Clp protease adaptor protein ClpS
VKTMPDDNNQVDADTSPNSGKDRHSPAGGTATKTKPSPKKVPSRKPPQMLPPWKVLLHNDDQNDMPFVIDAIVSLTPLNQQTAAIRTLEAHHRGLALLLVTHKERAELYQEQFQSKGLTVTIEPDEV